MGSKVIPKVLVGADASGLELRMLAHYINDPAYTKVITEGDPHEHHQKMAGLPTRDDAKTFIYAFNYGAGDQKIGSIISGTRQDGRRIKARFLKANPRLDKLITNVQAASKRGWLLGLDGRRVRMRRDHSGKIQTHKALNTLLQAAGAVVMKYSIVLLDQYIRDEGLHSIKLLDQHDEAQFECFPEEADKHGDLAVKSIRDAGTLLGLNCPLDAEYKVGMTWAQTH